MSLRTRVLLYLALAAIASCTLTVGFGVVLVRHHVATQQLTQLRAQADLLADAGGHPLAQRAGTHVYRTDARTGAVARARAGRRTATRLRRRGRQVPGLASVRFATAVEQAVGSTTDGQGTIHVRGIGFIYAARETTAGRIILVHRAAVGFAQWRAFLEALVLAGIVGSLLAVVLAVVLARRLTRPIRGLAGATRRLAGGEPGVRVPVHGQDELTELGHSFNAMSEELERSRESQRTFLESVSHELKTPLTSVRGYAEALRDDAVGPREAGEVIAAEALRLERLVRDLLDLARLGRADFAVAREPVDLAAVAGAAVRSLTVRARELGVTLAVDGEEAAFGLGDTGRLQQAVTNLIENALRLTPAGGAVTVRSRPGSLEVCDTGPGLRDVDLGRAFERFYLYDRYRADAGRAVGSGLGLAIVARLVAAMGGTVGAENRPGGGARFTVALPAAPLPVPA